MSRKDYDSVCSSMRPADGTLWPIPITLDIPEDLAGEIHPGERLALRAPEGVILTVLYLEELWQPDKLTEAEAVFGTCNEEHPGV